MSEIIHATYEIIRELGSGGGGIAYLANHLRLNKKVVLKADRRIVWFNADMLRREADILKELSHPNIPQVYDYFIEQDTALTVIDYIEGESLDKPLKRGETFSQPQVIKWAIQILDALDYLHSPIHGNPPRGFVHSDIKPSNIILKPNGDICLIDFNIALAFGEENAVGQSAGYASPEHYGLDYSFDHYGMVNDFHIKNAFAFDDDSSTIIAPTEQKTNSTEASDKGLKQTDTTGSAQKRILPDVRSDIYSLGATLYHLLSGIKPSRNARDVVPLSKEKFSPQIVDIISKAMNPNPDLRYQTAKDMRNAFLGLWDNDARVKRMHRRNLFVYIGCAILLAAGIFLAFAGLKRMETREQWLKLAEYSENAMEDGNSVMALDLALQSLDKTSDVFQPDYIPAAQKALTDALGVYDLSDGYKVYMTVELPAKPLFMRLSPDGSTLTCLCSDTFVVVDTESGSIIETLPAESSALSEAEYLDDHTIIYAGAQGITAYDLETKSILWTGEPATAISISGNKARVAGLYKDNTYAAVYDALTGTRQGTFDFGTGHQYYISVYDYFAGSAKRLHYDMLELNETGNLLGVSLSDGELKILDLQNPENTIDIYVPEDGYRHFEGGFYKQYFACSAGNNKESVFETYDLETFQTASLSPYTTLYGVHCYDWGVCLKQQNKVFTIDPATMKGPALITMDETVTGFASNRDYTVAASKNFYAYFDENAHEISRHHYKYNADFVLLNGNKSVIGSLNTSKVQLLNLQQHPENNVLLYDPQYSRYEAKISEDGKSILLFSPSEFLIYNQNGILVKQGAFPDPEFKYNQQFHREDGKSWLEVTYYDGHVINYSASDGAILSEEQTEIPDPSLLEVFETAAYTIKSPLYEPPEVYRKDTGQFVKFLSEEAFLTNITETDKYLIAQFVTYDQSENYGILLNKNLDILAKLPYLCDIVDQTLYFNYPSGYIRCTEIYDLNKLLEFARSGKGEKDIEGL